MAGSPQECLMLGQGEQTFTQSWDVDCTTKDQNIEMALQSENNLCKERRSWKVWACNIPCSQKMKCFKPEAGRSLGGDQENPGQSTSCATDPHAWLNFWEQSLEGVSFSLLKTN